MKAAKGKKFQELKLPFKSLGSVRHSKKCLKVSYAHQGCIYLIKNTVKDVIF